MKNVVISEKIFRELFEDTLRALDRAAIIATNTEDMMQRARLELYRLREKLERL